MASCSRAPQAAPIPGGRRPPLVDEYDPFDGADVAIERRQRLERVKVLALVATAFELWRNDTGSTIRLKVQVDHRSRSVTIRPNTSITGPYKFVVEVASVIDLGEFGNNCVRAEIQTQLKRSGIADIDLLPTSTHPLVLFGGPSDAEHSGTPAADPNGPDPDFAEVPA